MLHDPLQESRLINMKLIAAMALIGTMAVSGCAVSGPVSSNPSGGPSAVSPSATPEGTTPMGGSVTFSNGVALGTSPAVAFKPSQYASGKGGRAFSTTIKVTNNSQEQYKPGSDAYTTASAGGVECERIFDTAKGVESEPSTPVLPGRSVSWKAAWGCDAPAGSEIVLAAKADLVGDSAIFTGKLP